MSSSSSSISISSHEGSSTLDSGFPESSPETPSNSSSSSSDSNLDNGAGSQNSKSCWIPDFMHCRALTMSPLSQLQCFEIVIPPCENACSLETDDDITAR